MKDILELSKPRQTLTLTQVEFYFGDANLPTDKFLWEQTDGAENKPVFVATIHKFKRMQVFQPYSAVVAALKDSSFLVIDGEEGKETIKRKQAYDPSIKDMRFPRTIYAKGFGDEKPTTQLDLETFFAGFGKTRAVRLRRHVDGPDSGLFKGSVFVEYDSEETAKKFLETEPKPSFEGKELKTMTKSEYVEEKNQLIKDGKMQPNETRIRETNRGGRGRGGRGSHRGSDKRREDRDPDDWKKRREDDRKSGFRDDRNGRRNGRDANGRGRGNGRGGRDRDGDRPVKTGKAAVDVAALAVAEEDSKKRIRNEADGDESEVPAKKQDTKQTVETS